MTAIPARTASAQALGLIRLMRPKQWIKNGFVLAPLLFSGEFRDPVAISHASLSFVLFCLASSAAYIVNDLHDIESDRHHPVKSGSRPLACGVVPTSSALVLLAALYAALALTWFITPKVMVVIAGYLALNLAYTFFLKYQPVVDIFTIAASFVLRVYAGAVSLSVPLSAWMFVTTACLALYLAAVKRRQELSQSGSKGRKVLETYSPALVDRYAYVAAASALMFYSMFVMSTRPQLVITVPLVLFGLFRYEYVAEVLDGAESPTDALLNDWPLLLTVILWVTACAWALWPGQG